MKPIEEGCLALIIHTRENNGVVTIGKYIGVPQGLIKGSNHWEVDRLITYEYGRTRRHVDEHYLMRIDPDEESKEQFEAEEIPEGDVTTIETGAGE